MLSLHKWSSFVSELSFISSVFTIQRCGYKPFGEVPVDRVAAGAAESPSGESHTSVLPQHPLP